MGGTLGQHSRLYREFMEYLCWNSFFRNIYSPGYRIQYTGHIIPGISVSLIPLSSETDLGLPMFSTSRDGTTKDQRAEA